MLSWRTPFWLFIFCVCAVIMTFFTLKYFPQGDVRAVRTSLLSFNDEDINEIVISNQSENKIIKCVKKDNVWYVDDGYLVRANTDRITFLIDVLMGKGNSIRERITARQREKRQLSLKDFGFEASNTILKVATREDAVTIQIGAAAPYESTVFVMSDISSEVYIVEDVLRSNIPLNVDEIRDKTLFPHSISLINKIEIASDKQSSFVIERSSSNGVGWQMVSPVRAPVSMNVNSLLQSINLATIESFIWHPLGNIVSKNVISENLSPYGLDSQNSRAVVRIWLDKYTEPIEIRIGRDVPNDSGTSYAYSTIDNSVFTLDKTTVHPFFEGFETMRNHSVFSLPLHNIASVSYKNASEFCLLSKNEQLEWEITIPSKQPIKENSVLHFIESLSQIDDIGIVDNSVQLPKSFIELRFSDVNEKESLLYFYYDNAIHPTNVFLKTTSSSYTTKVDPKDLPVGFLDKNFPASFRSLDVLSLDAAIIQEIILKRSDLSQSIYFTSSGEWHSRDNAAGEISTEMVVDLLNRISDLKASWVAKLYMTDIKANGFVNPQAELTILLSKGNSGPTGMPTIILQLGSKLPEGGYFLRIKGEEELFVVDDDFAKALLEAKFY